MKIHASKWIKVWNLYVQGVKNGSIFMWALFWYYDFLSLILFIFPVNTLESIHGDLQLLLCRGIRPHQRVSCIYGTKQSDGGGLR